MDDLMQPTELAIALRRIAKVSYGATIEEARSVSKTQRDAADLIEQQADRITALESERDALLAAAGKEAAAWLVTSKRGLVRCAWTEKPSPDQLATCKFDGDTVTPLYDMPRGYPDTRWISVNERLPANWGSYLVWDKHEGMRTAWFQLQDGGLDGRKAGLWYSDERRADSDEQDYGITHWMLLPEAPANQKQAG
jgi:hypothetical protein